jgi:PAS domain S-box-containing protein
VAGNIEELTGYTPDEFRGMNLKFWLSCIHPENQNTLLEKYGKCLVSGETYRMEYRFRIKNGEHIYFEDNGIFLKDKKGNVSSNSRLEQKHMRETVKFFNIS